MLDLVDVYRISIQGKLKGYYLSPLYISVYYTHPDLEKNQYYLFKFMTASQKLLDAKIETRITQPPHKQHGKEYDHVILGIVKDAVSRSPKDGNRF